MFIELAKKRYSSRKYLNKPVEDEKLIEVLEAARISPSAANFQPWHFIVIRAKENLKAIHTVYHREWFKEAPVVIVACGDHHVAWKRADGKDHTDIDISIAVDHMTLAATYLGLSTCWICNFDAKKCCEILKLPENIEPIALIPLAYPADSTDTSRHSTKRKKIEEIVHWEKF
jgi:nitroreductase